ncbi:nuclear transport factor 2 family protein [Chryseobacterium sp. GMJ5]|uniref:Nuclear transport factor 2 family protein n=1 Tax=Chryseobacterium gilvum TaxID=2976534 RepID=A0ABT2VY26_9FLAO|nr:nuclear transport factor 2 family protein [Chryseobacterium gilvum]MCU7614896.1 nuclear transport factor 2 family protein [Chryseobacterium gilvum]
MKNIVVLALFISSFCFGQTSDNELIKAKIQQLFTGMKNADPEMIKTAFTENAILQSVSKNGTVKNENIAEFIASISKLSKNDADERITFESVLIDDNLASVFTPYEFYYKGNFSHCGVNSFQMVKQNGSWKIQYLIDTRRKENYKK